MLYNTFDKKSDKPQEISYFHKKLKNLPLYFNNNSVCQTPKYFALIFGNSFSFEQNLNGSRAKFVEQWNSCENYRIYFLIKICAAPCQTLNYYQWVSLSPLGVTPWTQEAHSQPTITYLKLTIETLEQGVKYVHSKQLRHEKDAIGIVLVSLLLTLNIFHTLL